MVKTGKNRIKVIALYLPQFHETPENNEFWGKGFTDWVTARKAKPLFDGHNQPNVPLSKNYYDLSRKRDIEWQIRLAKKYGIYGFGIYHYYFSEDAQALTRPSEIMLENHDLNMPFFFIWDNGSWKRTWSKLSGNDWAPLEDAKQEKMGNNSSEVLFEYILGKEPEWKRHFVYLLPYFFDYRYIKIENRPVFAILGYSLQIAAMVDYWDGLAREYGFAGVHIIYKYNPFKTRQKKMYTYFYEPHHSAWEGYWDLLKRRIVNKIGLKPALQIYDYDEVWQKLLLKAQQADDNNRLLGAFVGYDDTPRRGGIGKVVQGATPKKFENYMRELVEISKRQGKEYIFLTAWNEWGEGAYLEPDERYGFGYLEALRKVLVATGEFPNK